MWRAAAGTIAAELPRDAFIENLTSERDELAEKLRCSANVRYDLAGRVKELEAGIPTVDVARLTAQRDVARLCRDSAIIAHASLRFRLAEASEKTANLTDIIAAKDARIAELDSELAVLRRTACDGPISDPAPYPANPNAPKSIAPDTTSPTTKGQVPGPPGHNPFRDFTPDRRRIGG